MRSSHSVGERATKIGPRHERLAARDRELGLEGVGEVGLVGVGASPIDEEDRDRARARWDVFDESRRRGFAGAHVKREAIGVRHIDSRSRFAAR